MNRIIKQTKSKMTFSLVMPTITDDHIEYLKRTGFAAAVVLLFGMYVRYNKLIKISMN
jgi:hypothetical protein